MITVFHGTVTKKRASMKDDGTFRCLNLSVATSLRGDESAFPDVTLWGKYGETMAAMIKASDKEKGVKGTKVLVTGKIDKIGLREYNGKQFQEIKVTASEISCLSELAPKEEESEVEEDDMLSTSTKMDDDDF